jgi:hypothetical protein
MHICLRILVSVHCVGESECTLLVLFVRAAGGRYRSRVGSVITRVSLMRIGCNAVDE